MRGKLCVICKQNYVSQPEFDMCFECWQNHEEEGFSKRKEVFFKDGFSNSHIVFMTNQKKERFGITKNIDTALLNLNKKFPLLKLVFFRKFVKEYDAKKFLAWLNNLSEIELKTFLENYRKILRKLNF